MEIFNGLHFATTGFGSAASKRLKNEIIKYKGNISGILEKKV
jgi:hypothetical protein